MHDDNDLGGGCLTILIAAAIFCWLSDNWAAILLVIGAVTALAALIIGLKSYNAKAPERQAAAKEKAARDAWEKRDKEEASYWAYVHSYEDSELLSSKLHTANVIIDKLHEETDETRRTRILAFYDRYLPVMTEILEASKHGDTDIDDSVSRFTDTVKAFSKSLYKAEDVVTVNKSVLESMAIRDGYYDPYAEDFAPDAEQAESAAEDR